MIKVKYIENNYPIKPSQSLHLVGSHDDLIWNFNDWILRHIKNNKKIKYPTQNNDDSDITNELEEINNICLNTQINNSFDNSFQSRNMLFVYVS